MSFGSFGDTDPYHGWVIGFSATNLVQLTNYVFCTTPNATTNDFGINAAEGAIWMGGNGLCVDASNNLYFETGNGSFSAHTNGGDYGDTFVKLSTTNGLAVPDFFTPKNQASDAANDLDLGSGGPCLLPDSVGSAAHPHLMAVVSKGLPGIVLFDADTDQESCRATMAPAPHEAAFSRDGRILYVPVYSPANIGQPGPDEHTIHFIRTSDCGIDASLEFCLFPRQSLRRKVPSR